MYFNSQVIPHFSGFAVASTNLEPVSRRSLVPPNTAILFDPLHVSAVDFLAVTYQKDSSGTSLLTPTLMGLAPIDTSISISKIYLFKTLPTQTVEAHFIPSPMFTATKVCIIQSTSTEQRIEFIFEGHTNLLDFYLNYFHED